jgi:hypothetical protein
VPYLITMEVVAEPDPMDVELPKIKLVGKAADVVLGLLRRIASS